MLLAIIIAALIVGLALYDHFSTKNWQLITSDERNDVVFEKRNKAYGAYQIRRDYNKRIFIILFGITAGCGGLYGAALTMHPKEKKNDTRTKIDVPLEKPIEDEEVIEIPDKEVEKPVQTTEAEIYKFDIQQILDPTKNELDTMEIPDPNKQAGNVTSKGKNPFDEPGISGPTGNVTEPKKGDSLGVFINVTETAVFIGGRPALLDYLTKAIKSDLEGTGTCKLKFIVNEEGKVTKVWVKQKVEGCPECDEAAVKAVKNMPPWEPAKLNGEPVASYFYLPIVFRF
jgi:protein TonB